MAHINVNLNAAESEPHADGPTLVRVKSAEVKDNKSTEGQHILWTLEVVQSENPTPLWLRTSLKSNALFVLNAFLKAAGVQKNPDGTFDTDEAIGRELFVTVGTEMWEGEPRNTVDRPFLPA